MAFDKNSLLLSPVAGVRAIAQRLQSATERLTSGLNLDPRTGRLDAAALHLSNRSSTDSKISARARDNVYNASSLLNHADEALSELESTLTSMSELADRATSSSLSADQRTAINAEFQALKTRYDSVITNTSYNGRNLLDGSAQEITVQAGATSSSSINFEVGAKLVATATSGGDPEVTTGDGTFGSETVLVAGTQYNAVIIGDFNNDTFNDVSSFDSSTGDLTTYRGDGTGSFPSSGSSNYGTTGWDMVTGDFDEDGDADMVVMHSGPSLTMHIGDGMGAFLPAGDTSTGSTVGSALVVGDFNGDGNIDVISAQGGGVNLKFHLGDGAGATGDGVAAGAYAAPAVARMDFIASGSINSSTDALTDLAVATTNGIAIETSNGNGTFTLATTIGTGTSYTSVDVKDINNDGKADIIAGKTAGGGVSVFLGVGDGTFGGATNYALGTITSASAIEVSDLDGDNYKDIVVHAGSATEVLLNDGTGLFGSATLYGSASLAFGYDIAVGDLNGDGVPDLAYGDANGDLCVRFQNTVTTGGGGGGSSISRTLPSLSLTSTSNAETAVTTLATYLDAVSVEQGNVTAQISRLQSTYQHLTRETEDLDRATGRVRDADVATTLTSVIVESLKGENANKALNVASITFEQQAKILTLLKSA